MEIKITIEDLQSAEQFLVQYLTEQVPEASFEDGTAMRDLAIKAFAHIYAFLRSENTATKSLQSLEQLRELTDVEAGGDTSDTIQAVDQLMSNWFLGRRSGLYSRGLAQVHFSEKSAVTIYNDTKFWRTAALAFYLNNNNNSFVISENQMVPRFDTKGVLIDYVANVPLQAAHADSVYDFDPGRFVSIEAPSGLPYVTFAEHTEAFDGGQGTETSVDLIDRAGTAISIRNLINNRSCDVALRNYLGEIKETLTIGMGEPEMVRDRRTEIAQHIQLNIGGHYDTYIELPLTTVEENHTIGGYQPRPDGIINVFRDPLLTYDLGNKFTDLGVEVGHVLYITQGIVGVPRGFQIVNVFDHELHVSEATPFPQASDEIDVNEVWYSIGWLSPDFDEIDFGGGLYLQQAKPSTSPTYSHVPPGTSRHITMPGMVILSGLPIQDIISVEVTDPDVTGIVDPSTGTIKFPNRVNTPPIEGSILGTSQYQLEILNPLVAQSSFAVSAVRVGYLGNEGIFDGKNLRVTLQTPYNFKVAHNYVRNYNIRVQAANHLVRARHPAWIGATIPFRYKRTTTDVISSDEAQEKVATFINNFPPNETLDMSDISQELRNAYPDEIGAVFPFSIEYDLHMPDGQVIQFSTTDIVSVFVTAVNGVTILNSGDIVVPDALQVQGITSISTEQDLRAWYLLVGMTDRTVRYRSKSELITLFQQG
jgi:hypothetical protein